MKTEKIKEMYLYVARCETYSFEQFRRDVVITLEQNKQEVGDIILSRLEFLIRKKGKKRSTLLKSWIEQFVEDERKLLRDQ